MNLYDELTKDIEYYAKKIVLEGFKQPIYNLTFLPDYIDNRLKTVVTDFQGNQISVSNKKCYYLIMQKSYISKSYENLYIGYSSCRLDGRLRRFGEEICNLTELIKKSTGHRGGKKGREFGITRDDLYLKYVEFDQLEFEIPKHYEKIIDARLAKKLKCSLNTYMR